MTQTFVGDNPTAVKEALSSLVRKTPVAGLITRLRGVPKGPLKTVLGRELGEHVWREARGKACWPESAVADVVVLAGLIRHLSLQAARELHRAGRHAKFVRVTVWHLDGSRASARDRLPQATQAPGEIAETAAALLERIPTSPAQVQSVDLDVTTAAEAAPASTEPFCWVRATPRGAPA